MIQLKDTLEDLKITNDEMNKLSNAFKNEEFRKLFREYAEELQNPDNRKLYEDELTAMENERGIDVEFINPIPGHVLKTIQNGEKKIFVNICSSEKIKPATIVKLNTKNVTGNQWSIPHSFSPPREDIDKKKDSCLVYDVVFNPQTYQKGENDSCFRKMLHDTALQGIETAFKVSVDQTNFRILKMKMKGCPSATVIRKKKDDYEKIQKDLQGKDLSPLKFPYPQDTTESKPMAFDVKDTTSHSSSEYTQPKYTIKYCDEFDIANYVGEQVQHNLRPKKMIVEIKLPLVTSANSVDLDIDDTSMKLLSDKPVKYKLDLKFTYPIISEKGKAIFDKSTRILKLDLPIVRLPEQTNVVMNDLPLIVDQDNFPKSSLIDDSFPAIENEENVKDKLEEIQNENFVSIMTPLERKIPNIKLKSRMNTSFIFILCEMKNVTMEDIQIICEEAVKQTQSVTLTFFTCGQGGWRTYYSMPLTVAFVGSNSLTDNDVNYRVSKDNITIKISIQCTKISAVSYQDQILNFEKEDDCASWKCLDLSDKISDEINNEDSGTFNVAYGNVGKETFKIICAPLTQVIDIKKEFPKEIEQICLEEDTINEDVKTETECQLDNETEDISIETFNETNKSNTEEIVPLSVDKAVHDSNESKEETKFKELEGLVSSEYFEERRDSIHRTYCAVDLDEKLLFDLE